MEKKTNHIQTSMELISLIIARMKAEESTSASSSEINRCLSNCGLSTKLIKIALENRFELCKEFCNENTHGCDCDIERDEDWARTEDDKLENKDITYG